MNNRQVITANKDSSDLPTLLLELFSNKIGAIRIPMFLSNETCELAVSSIKEYGFDFYKDVYPPIGKIGITQFEHQGNEQQKLVYFRKSQLANETRATIFKEVGDPVEAVMSLFSGVFDTYIATDPFLNKVYFAGLIRNIHSTLLHLDFAPRDANGWSIDKITSQIAWNIVLQESESGGETVVYNKPYIPEYEHHKLSHSYGYSKMLVEDSPKVEFRGTTGDLLLFNSRNFHEVLSTEGNTLRLTVSSFMGLTKTHNIVFWS